jgi:alpha-galactosidase
MKLGLGLLLAPLALAYNNGVAKAPAMGWNTWCTEASCGQSALPPHSGSMHDVCNAQEMLEIAHALLANGMYQLGFNRVHADDCELATSRTPQGELQVDPTRFPNGWKDFAQQLRALGFMNGLYTSAGNTTCSSGGRPGSVPGSFGHYVQDAQSFANWTVDYVKIDFCGIDHGIQGQPLHEAFSAALNATGRPIWLELCRGYNYPPPQYTQQVAQSARVSGDHHDDWMSTLGVIESLAVASETGLSGTAAEYWGYGDFLMTGGAGCDVNATTHCPGQTDQEYITEFSIWSITASPLIVATDVRNMTSIMKQVLLNEEVIAVNQDYKAAPGRRIAFLQCSLPLVCQLYARNLSDGSVAAVVYNAADWEDSMQVDLDQFSSAWGPSSTVFVRDLWKHADLGTATGSFNVSLPAHGVAFYRLSSSQLPPLQVERLPLTPAAKEYLASVN